MYTYSFSIELVFQVLCYFCQEFFSHSDRTLFQLIVIHFRVGKHWNIFSQRLTDYGMKDHGQSFCFTVLAVWSLPGRSSVLKTAGTFFRCKHACFYRHWLWTIITRARCWKIVQFCYSDADPDPYVFGSPGSGSGSISQIYGMDPEPSIIKHK